MFEDITFKIFKGIVLPRATSSNREVFYQHTLPISPSLETATLRSLVVLWDCDDEGGNLKIFLCCPRGKRGVDFWREVIPHPSEWMVVANSESADVKDDEFDDLLQDKITKKKMGE